MSDQMVRLWLKMSPESWAHVESYAAEEGCSLTEAITDMVCAHELAETSAARDTQPPGPSSSPSPAPAGAPPGPELAPSSPPSRPTKLGA